MHALFVVPKNMSKSIEPSTKQTAFSCPHCGAYTTQYWYSVRAHNLSGERKIPFIPGKEEKERLEASIEIPVESKKTIRKWFADVGTGLVFFRDGDHEGTRRCVENLHLSECYNCSKIAVWIHENLVFPAHKNGSIPNTDLPDEIKRDFEEARNIVESSPRGAAALLRLCVQKLCVELGEKGKNIDADIASLVSKGLDPLVQQALDVVRVVGNEAVHPGVIDLDDDKEIALRLFDLINAITDQLISHPKRVKDMYSKLPEGKRKAIEDRNEKAKPKAQQDGCEQPTTCRASE
ncbi:MAG: DUF4145 domain-containing protein [Verrucomicrobiales bacterium]|nr:DUF4145 domain-containing protein [Verrucomicrobiales bacterium]